MNFEIGFLGYGRMARAISAGLDRSGRIPYSRQMISGRNRDKLAEAVGSAGVGLAADNRELARMCPMVVLGVAPELIVPVLEEIAPEISGQTIISMAAGVRLEDMSAVLPPSAGVVRTMPNMPALIGRGVILACAPPAADPAHLAKAVETFSSVGLCLKIGENLFDAGTAVSGSGTAYFFSIMESMVRGAVRLGLPFEEARDMVVQTALGAAALAAERPGEHLAALRDQASGTAGTTVEGLYIFEREGLGGIIQTTLEAAADRSRRMSRKE